MWDSAISGRCASMMSRARFMSAMPVSRCTGCSFLPRFPKRLVGALAEPVGDIEFRVREFGAGAHGADLRKGALRPLPTRSRGCHQTVSNKKRENKSSYDVNDFDMSFARGLSLKDGAATLTEYTSEILYEYFIEPARGTWRNTLLAGGGRKNKLLIKSIEDKIKSRGVLNSPFKFIDDFGIDGDFVESQAFAYLAIRSYLKLPISFPQTTGVSKPCSGGLIFKN